MMVWILVKPDAFVEDREEAAREADQRNGRSGSAGNEDEFFMKSDSGEDDVDEDLEDDAQESDDRILHSQTDPRPSAAELSTGSDVW